MSYAALPFWVCDIVCPLCCYGCGDSDFDLYRDSVDPNIDKDGCCFVKQTVKTWLTGTELVALRAHPPPFWVVSSGDTSYRRTVTIHGCRECCHMCFFAQPIIGEGRWKNRGTAICMVNILFPSQPPQPS